MVNVLFALILFLLVISLFSSLTMMYNGSLLKKHSDSNFTYLSDERYKTVVNYPFAKDKWASRFTATCLLFRRVRSLTVAPHVYSQVPYEVLMSCTDNANIQLLI